MADGMYEVLALLPAASDFTLETAVAHFGGLTFTKYRCRKLLFDKHPLRAELARSPRARKFTGFRVFYDEWAVVAWLDTSRSVAVESREFAEEDDLPAAAEVIAGCKRRLSVWSDEDLDFDWTDEFNEFTDQLRERFGAFIYDCVNGCWWT